MTQLYDLTDQPFGRLVVRGRAASTPSGATRWLCECACGGTAIVTSSNLRNGQTVSCGCRMRETRPEWIAATRHSRFWSAVDRRGADECWPWTGYLHRYGYGERKFDGRMRKAHQIAYLLTHGPIAEGLLVRHTCHYRACCNPAHLILGTHQDNMDDLRQSGHRKGINAGEKAPHSKLSGAQAAEIRSRYRGPYQRPGMPHLAREYGVSTAAIWAIVHGKVHVPGVERDGRPPEHATLRRWVFARDAGRCAACGEVAEIWHVDHLVEVRDGGSNELTNLETRCVPCHRERHAERSVLETQGRLL